MKKIFLSILFILLITFSTCTPASRVIEILSFDPQDAADSKDKVSENFEKVLEESFNNAKTLVDADQLGFYNALTEEDMRFFAPKDFSSYAISYAHFQGLLSKRNNKQFPEVAIEINNFEVKAVSQENGIYSLVSEKQDLDNIFRIIDTSILLEAPSFECEHRNKQIELNKNSLPSSVIEACGQAAKDLGLEGDVSIQDLLDMYREGAKNPNNNVPGLESCVEQYVFSVYFANDVLIKSNAGELLSEMGMLLGSTEKTPRFFSYNIPNEMFLAVLTAIQKTAISSEKVREGSLGTKLYWSSIRKFNKKILLEVYEETKTANKEAELKVIIQGQSNQVLLNMGIKLDMFLREIGPFMVPGYSNFKALCDSNFEGTYDLRTSMLPKGSFLDVINIKSQLMFVLIILGAIIIMLAIGYRQSGKKGAEKKGEFEFKQLGSDDVDLDESQEEGISKRKLSAEVDNDKFDIV